MASCCSFPLRCGIFFGDTIDTIIEKERYEIKDRSQGTVVFNGAVSGLEGGETVYNFYLDGGLFHMGYSYVSMVRMFEYPVEAIRQLFTLRKGIVSKYGNEQYHMKKEKNKNKTEGAEYYDIITAACKYDEVRSLYEWHNNNEFETFGWIIPWDDSYVVIHLSHSRTYNDFEKCYVDLGYTLFSSSEYNRLMEVTKSNDVKEKAKAQAVRDSLLADL